MHWCNNFTNLHLPVITWAFQGTKLIRCTINWKWTYIVLSVTDRKTDKRTKKMKTKTSFRRHTMWITKSIWIYICVCKLLLNHVSRSNIYQINIFDIPPIYKSIKSIYFLFESHVFKYTIRQHAYKYIMITIT